MSNIIINYCKDNLDGDDDSCNDDDRINNDYSGESHDVLHTENRESPCDIASSPLEAPRQPKVKFPLRSFGKGRPRAFNSMWYKSFPWLEYSVSLDAAFCYPCRLFKCGVGGGRSEQAFSKTGFRNWKNAIGKAGTISCHNACISHKQVMVSWKEYSANSKNQTTVRHRLDSTQKQLISDNRHYISTIIEVLLVCAKQNLALRGHRESDDSLNRGNFLAILSLIANHDPVVKKSFVDHKMPLIHHHRSKILSCT